MPIIRAEDDTYAQELGYQEAAFPLVSNGLGDEVIQAILNRYMPPEFGNIGFYTLGNIGHTGVINRLRILNSDEPNRNDSKVYLFRNTGTVSSSADVMTIFKEFITNYVSASYRPWGGYYAIPTHTRALRECIQKRWVESDPVKDVFDNIQSGRLTQVQGPQDLIRIGLMGVAELPEAIEKMWLVYKSMRGVLVKEQNVFPTMPTWVDVIDKREVIYDRLFMIPYLIEQARIRKYKYELQHPGEHYPWIIEAMHGAYRFLLQDLMEDVSLPEGAGEGYGLVLTHLTDWYAQISQDSDPITDALEFTNRVFSMTQLGGYYAGVTRYSEVVDLLCSLGRPVIDPVWAEDDPQFGGQQTALVVVERR